MASYGNYACPPIAQEPTPYCYLLIAEDLSIVLHSGPNDEPFTEAFGSMDEAVQWACAANLRIICVV